MSQKATLPSVAALHRRCLLKERCSGRVEPPPSSSEEGPHCHYGATAPVPAAQTPQPQALHPFHQPQRAFSPKPWCRVPALCSGLTSPLLPVCAGTPPPSARSAGGETTLPQAAASGWPPAAQRACGGAGGGWCGEKGAPSTPIPAWCRPAPGAELAAEPGSSSSPHGSVTARSGQELAGCQQLLGGGPRHNGEGHVPGQTHNACSTPTALGGRGHSTA